jgi:hypothetical protein
VTGVSFLGAVVSNGDVHDDAMPMMITSEATSREVQYVVFMIIEVETIGLEPDGHSVGEAKF